MYLKCGFNQQQLGIEPAKLVISAVANQCAKPNVHMIDLLKMEAFEPCEKIPKRSQEFCQLVPLPLLRPQNHKTLEPAQLWRIFTKQTDAAKN